MSENEIDLQVAEAIRAMVQQEVAAAMAVVAKRDAPPSPARTGETPAPLKGVDPYSLVPFVQHVLKEAGGGPMHAREIAPQVYALGFQHKWPPKYADQLVRSVNALASPSQHPDLFERVAPRTIRLR
jgi:hypothetical protein